MGYHKNAFPIDGNSLLKLFHAKDIPILILKWASNIGRLVMLEFMRACMMHVTPYFYCSKYISRIVSLYSLSVCTLPLSYFNK